jgi:hypothetical protein
VEGDVASAVAFVQFYATGFQEFRGRYYIRGFRVAAQRDYGLVFEQEEDVADLFFFAESD